MLAHLLPGHAGGREGVGSVLIRDGVIADVVFADVAGILVMLIDADVESSTVVVVSLRDARVTAEAGTDRRGRSGDGRAEARCDLIAASRSPRQR